MMRHSKALPMTKAEMKPKAIDITKTIVATTRTGLNIWRCIQSRAIVSNNAQRPDIGLMNLQSSADSSAHCGAREI
jgi:hypothetical protein